MAGKRPFRVYFGPHESETNPGEKTDTTGDTVKISLSEFLHTCDDATQSDRAWLKDFSEEQILIPTDLFEVIRAYQHYQRRSA